jgi:hypothetical protein
MRRLLDQPTQHESLQGDAVRLLRSVEPYRSDPGSKQRVRMAMLSRRTTRKLSWLPAVVMLPMGFASALGFASVRRHWLVREEAPQAVLVHAERPAIPVHPVHPAPPPAPEPEPAVTVEAPAPKRPVAAVPRPAAKAVPERTPAAIAEENARLVVDAMGALRRGHDPARAESLLDEYMRLCPDGPLSEEALALSIEAASAAEDPRVRSLAARYLASYPRGRFREAAERVLSRPAQ